MDVALLAGGTGGAKLAEGLRDLLHGSGTEPAQQPGRLSVIANTADDIEIHGVHVSPDPDLISYRLAGVLDTRGFGIAGEGHERMDALRATGEEVWFELGDEDLAVCAARAAALADGLTLTAAHERATSAYPSGGARVLPMSDDPVRTWIETSDGVVGIQQFLIREQSTPEIRGVGFDGIKTASITPEVRAAVSAADLIVVGPSNPVISIAPILALPGMAEALAGAAAPVLGVSPIVGGEVLKGPTAKFLAAADFQATSGGVAEFYAQNFPGVFDAWIADEPVPGHQHVLFDVAMPDPAGARRLAADVVLYGTSLIPAGAAR